MRLRGKQVLDIAGVSPRGKRRCCYKEGTKELHGDTGQNAFHEFFCVDFSLFFMWAADVFHFLLHLPEIEQQRSIFGKYTVIVICTANLCDRGQRFLDGAANALFERALCGIGILAA